MEHRKHSLKGLAAIALAMFVVCPAWGEMVSSGNESRARRNLAKKLLKLSKSLDMKEASFKSSAGSGGKDYNANDGNSFTSNTTYHSNVWSRCLEWVGGQYCNRWLDPYVSSHGFGGDKSPLEGYIAEQWQKRKTRASEQGADYAIWDVQRLGGGSNIDVDGKFDKRGVIDWRLKEEVKNGAAQIGADTAVRQIQRSYDENSGDGSNIMPNMESLRMMASRWTKMFRNRMVANLGEARVSRGPVEFALGEDTPDCDAYIQAAQEDLAVTVIQERVEEQPILQPETQAQSLQQRYQACLALQQASVYAVNPTVENGNVSQGDQDGEAIDEWRARLNIAAIDYAGVDVTTLPKPAYASLREDDLTSVLREYEEGGLNYNNNRRSVAQQLQGYNAALKNAAVGMQEVAARSPVIRDISGDILGYQIQPGTMSAVRINHLTPEMKQELQPTGFPGTGSNRQDDPTRTVEDSPSELAVRKLN